MLGVLFGLLMHVTVASCGWLKHRTSTGLAPRHILAQGGLGAGSRQRPGVVFACWSFQSVEALGSEVCQASSRLRSIQAVFSCTCMLWVSTSAVGSSLTLSSKGKIPRAVRITASWP